jgi:hypothetical protein
MPHLSLTERNRVINIYLRLNNRRYGNKAHVVQEIAREIYSISISIPGIRNLINKWLHTGTVQDKPKHNKHKCLITDEGMLAINSLLLKNPFYTCLQIKHKLNLVASLRTIRDYINILGWAKVNTKYCQIVSPVNQVKRFAYACCCKIFNEQYDDVLVIDETTIEIRIASYKNWRKASDGLLRAAGGKIGKPKHSNVKIHLLGGISRKGLTPLVIFGGKMCSIDFQHYLTLGVVPFLEAKLPYRHRLFMDNDPKVNLNCTIILNCLIIFKN